MILKVREKIYSSKSSSAWDITIYTLYVKDHSNSPVELLMKYIPSKMIVVSEKTVQLLAPRVHMYDRCLNHWSMFRPEKGYRFGWGLCGIVFVDVFLGNNVFLRVPLLIQMFLRISAPWGAKQQMQTSNGIEQSLDWTRTSFVETTSFGRYLLNNDNIGLVDQTKHNRVVSHPIFK